MTSVRSRVLSLGLLVCGCAADTQVPPATSEVEQSGFDNSVSVAQPVGASEPGEQPLPRDWRQQRRIAHQRMQKWDLQAVIDKTDWAGMGLTAPRLVELGPIEVNGRERVEAYLSGAAYDGTPRTSDVPPSSKGPTRPEMQRAEGASDFLVVHVPTATAYVLEFQKHALLDMYARGDSEPSHRPAVETIGSDTANGALVPKAWSGGIDERRRRAIADGVSDNSYPARSTGLIAMGVGDGCTGALVSRYSVQTAAHCLIDNNYITEDQRLTDDNGNEWNYHSYSDAPPSSKFGVFQPRADPSYDADEAGGAASPTWGTWWPYVYIVPIRYALVCGDEDDCLQNDWGIAVYAPPGQIPGYFGYRALNRFSITLQGYVADGYPGCEGDANVLYSRPGGYFDNPPGCQWPALYGQGKTCHVANGRFPDGYYDLVYDTSCDASPGMSGSPLWYADSNWMIRTMGVAASVTCLGGPTTPGPPTTVREGCTSSDTHPTVMSTLTGDRAGLIATLRSAGL